ncbi:hypothetical protein Pcinc_016432 [Petrolisthes cinctipes]|uniref:Uncharacterized protein n=1 Tax=Petrolisthes cinctipes TaxID=88211 RepID=A0AAE1FWB7_PETCI|nr:hypothetical protein Pcinc_016432 [Petrolisthes cinctipes]
MPTRKGWTKKKAEKAVKAAEARWKKKREMETRVSLVPATLHLPPASHHLHLVRRCKLVLGGLGYVQFLQPLEFNLYPEVLITIQENL